MYRITIDRDACDGVFACLTRDPRFVEDGDGLATVDPNADPAPPADSDEGTIRRDDGTVIAAFDDGRLDEAEQAAAACPFDAIDVEELKSEPESEANARTGADDR